MAEPPGAPGFSPGAVGAIQPAVGPATYVEPFGASSPDASRLGGKGASLARLVAFGHRVPPGFTVTVEAFRTTLRYLGLDGAVGALAAAIAGDGDVAAAGAPVTRGLLEGRLPQDVLDAVVEQVDDLELWGSNPDGLIVRSSATVEDSSAHSFAGIFESIPIGRPEDLEPT
ncbi:MAG TPA: PEP/pyruvate-binding domain-containing protein, partial [Actinomycetota bacterium]|nr:PEP/pyruvate-binding domain-containing protein [Actinomycetota bacterium]